jgi:Peptidase family M23/NlpC/P60 family
VTSSAWLYRSFPSLMLHRTMESACVALASFNDWGKSYRITRELSSITVDCSTLVSQAHWMGAAIQTPFIAENQRVAPNGLSVPDTELMPGDLIFAYPGLDGPPARQHNHVALYLGPDASGEPRVLESVEGFGVQLTPLEKCRRDGGVRRYCIYPCQRFDNGDWRDVVRRVPKLGRLGARVSKDYRSGIRHRGLDIYAGTNCPVRAPRDAIVMKVEAAGSDGTGRIYLHNEDAKCLDILAPIITKTGLRRGVNVKVGEAIGMLGKPSHLTTCYATTVWRGYPKLHWELWCSDGDLARSSPAPDLVPPALDHIDLSTYRACNPAYAMKLGLCSSPLLWHVADVLPDER